MHTDARKALQFAASMPVVLMLFDVLEVDGNDVTALPYVERHAVLERLGLAGPNWQTPPMTVGHGQAVLNRRAPSGWKASSPNGWTRPTRAAGGRPRGGR